MFNNNAQRGRNAISVTPNQHGLGEEPDEMTPRLNVPTVSEPVTPERPSSVHSSEDVTKTVKVQKKQRNKKAMRSIPKNAHHHEIFCKEHPSYRGQQNTNSNYYMQRAPNIGTGRWQALTSSGQTVPFNSLNQGRGLQGNHQHSNRVKNIIAQKSAPSSLVKMWPTISCQESVNWQSPLSVMAQKRLKLMKHSNL